MAIIPWQGKAERIDDYDLPRIGHIIGVGEDIVHMVLDVESRGTGFDKNGVLKLFEEHVFYRNLPVSKRDEAVRLKIAYPKWRKNYSNNHATFIRAYEFDKTAALKACSWGLGQVLGENFKMLGYASPFQMVQAFAKHEANQLEGMIKFIIANNIDDELRAMEKTTNRNELVRLASVFARVYNGRGYAKNKYHTRLVAALLKWRKIPDTKWSPEMAVDEELIHELDTATPDATVKDLTQQGIIDMIIELLYALVGMRK